MVRYSTRACAHSDCWLARRRLNELPWHQIEQLPFSLLKNLGLLDEAHRLIQAKNQPRSRRQKRLDKIFGFASSVSIALLLAAMASANAQGVSNCLADAAKEYKTEWLKHCPGGVQYNFPACQLPRYVADEIAANLDRSRNLCLQIGNAAALDRADEVQRGPGLTRDQPEPAAPATADNEPRRKFWISPQ
jgi:hypothetical protein